MKAESARSRVVIVGGGLAGLAAGVQLAESGLRPLVLEKRPFLGGRAFSFKDPDTGVEVDNGQHVFVGACTEYMEFLRAIGAWDNVRMPERLDAPVLMNGKVSRLQASALPGSLGNLSAILRYGHMSWRGKLRLLYGLARLRMAGGSSRERENETFYDWLMRHGQSEETIERFWNLIALPALNDDIRDVSAEAGIMLFRVALLGPARNSAIGYPVVGLSSLAGEAARRHIETHGGEVRTGVDVAELMPGGETAVRLADDSFIESEAVITAVPAGALVEMFRQDAAAEFFAPAKDVETSPIVGIHIWYDRPVLDDNFVATLGSPLQWVFNVTRMQQGDDEAGGQHIAISLSGAWRWKDMSKSELQETFVAAMEDAFPRAAGATVTRFLVVKMLEATFRVTPGAGRWRLPQETPVPGLFLAGDWTSTGWPSTMEGAVRSGNLAADAVTRFLSDGRGSQ